MPLSFTTLGRFHKLRPVHLIIGLSPPPGSPQAAPIAMSVAGQKYHYRLMRLWRNSWTVWNICSTSLFLDQMDPLAPLLLAAFIKSEKNSPKRKNPFAWICSDLTGGLRASNRVAFPFRAHQLTYLWNRIWNFQGAFERIKRPPHLLPRWERGLSGFIFDFLKVFLVCGVFSSSCH